MCGIGGFKRFGDTPIRSEQVDSMLLALQERGADATGVALMEGATIKVCKRDIAAAVFVRSQEYTKFMEENMTPAVDTVLAHTRFATKGNPRDNDNNHPLFSGRSAVIHNGCISNDTFLFNDKDLERKATVDSDILRAIIDREGLTQQCIRRLARVSGSAAVAAVHPEFPGKVLLVRSASPLVLALTDDMLAWASTKHALHLSLRKWEERFGIWCMQPKVEAYFQNVPDHTALLIGPKGQEWHQECKIASYPRNDPDYRIHDTFADRQQRWNRALAAAATTNSDDDSDDTEGHLVIDAETDADYVRCPNPTCRTLHKITDDLKDTPLSKLFCKKCGSALVKEEQADA